MSETGVRKTWNRFSDTNKDLTHLPTMNDQDALMAEDEKIVAVEPAAAAVPSVDDDVRLAVHEDDDREGEGAVGLDDVELVEVKRELCKLQKKWCAIR